MRKSLLALAALLLAGAFAGWRVGEWPNRLRYPGEENFAEGMMLAEMQHLRQGIPIYAPATGERFDAANYGPLYFLLGARLIDPESPAYFPVRLPSVLATLGCAAACALLAYWLSRSGLAAVLAALLFLSFGLVSSYGTSLRPDLVAVLGAVGGFALAYRLRDRRALLLSAPLFLLSFFYKPQFVAAPLAVAIFLLREGGARLATVFVALLGAGGLGLLALFQFVVFPGQAFFDHFFRYNFLPFTLSAFAKGALFLFVVLLVPLLVGLEWVRLHPDKLLGTYLACALLLSLATAAREGSDTNYFLESVLLLSALFAALVAKRIRENARVGELLFLMGVTLFLGQWFATPAPRSQDFSRDQAIQGFLRRSFPPGTRALGYFTGDLVRAGLVTPISNLYHFSGLVDKGKLSDRQLVAQIEGRRFGVIALNFDLRTEKDPHWLNYYLTEAVRRAILAHYEPVAALDLPGPEKFRAGDRFYPWVPRPTQPPPAPRATAHE